MTQMLLDALSLALRSIHRNMLRSFLTVLGIVIGVSAVITMVTLGNGATQAVQNQIASLGSNLLMARTSVTVVANGRNWTTSVVGSSDAWFDTNNWRLAAGRRFEEAELQAGAPVCVIGETVRREVFESRNALGERLRVRQFSCEVVGLLAAKGQAAMGNDQDDVVMMPLHTFQRRVTGNLRVATLLVSMKDAADSASLKASLGQLLRERRKLAAADEDNFNVLDTKQLAETMSSTAKVMTTLLGAVAAVSLLVGGIGIMNIMLVSVTERTREIGLRLAIGALEREVLSQFLIEAVVLAALGGLVGIVLATAASVVLARVMDVPYMFGPAINLLSFLFAAAIGVLFGYFPARRAAQMDPIEALRHE